MKNWILLILIVGITYNFTCNRQGVSHFLKYDEAIKVKGPKPGLGKWENKCCRVFENYAPDTTMLGLTPKRTIQVNLHFMNSSDSTQNFTEEAGTKNGKELIKACNYFLGRNKKMHLPIGNTTPALPLLYDFELTPDPSIPNDDGIYFHYDDDLYYYILRGKDRNHYKKDVVNKYGIQQDSVLNIFILPHHPDSLNRSTYNGKSCGVSLGTSLKLAGWYEKGASHWAMSTILNHEVGHVYSLQHSWAYNDGCEDTPKNPNCFSYSDKSPCDSLVSNNVMDYNAWQNSWTPCQIGKIRRRMTSTDRAQRKFVKKTWCEVDEEQFITINDSLHLAGARDLESSLVVAKGGVLKISCRVSIPKDGRIVVEPGGQLILDNCTLHNACGLMWEGIEIVEKGNKKGEVVFVGSPKIQNIKNILIPTPPISG